MENGQCSLKKYSHWAVNFAFKQFTYLFQCPLDLDDLGLTKSLVK